MVIWAIISPGKKTKSLCLFASRYSDGKRAQPAGRQWLAFAFASLSFAGKFVRLLMLGFKMMKRLATTFWVSIVTLCCGASPPPVVTEDLAKGDWIYVSHDSKGHLTETKLDQKQVVSLIKILNSQATASRPANPQPGPPPSVAPALLIEIRSKDGKRLAQVLGAERDVISLRGFSITDKKVVAKFHDIVHKKP